MESILSLILGLLVGAIITSVYFLRNYKVIYDVI